MTANDLSINDAPTTRPISASSGGRRLASGDMILDRYAVVRELGEGGMGVVYQCLDTVGGVEVAVKGLPPEVSRNEDEMDDIRANYQIVRKLRHPNIAGVATLEKDAAAGDYYLVMDLAAGVTLKRWTRRHPDAGIDAKLAILRQVAAALDYAHAEKVIHRDVKPENVMVDDDGRVKVLDFGLAAQIRSSQSRTSNTVTSKGGTPGYKSPEQWLGRPQQAPADVYAFGVMAYWLFAGRLPFDGDDPAVLGHAVLSAPVEPIPDLPAHINTALVKALAKKPEDRFSSCGAFMDALECRSAAHMGGTGRAGAPRPPQGGSSSRANAKIILAAVALALAVVGGWWYYQHGQKNEQSRVAVETARQSTAAEESKRMIEGESMRKSEEAARKMVAEQAAKLRAEEVARQKAVAEVVGRKAEETACQKIPGKDAKCKVDEAGAKDLAEPVIAVAKKKWPQPGTQSKVLELQNDLRLGRFDAVQKVVDSLEGKKDQEGEYWALRLSMADAYYARGKMPECWKIYDEFFKTVTKPGADMLSFYAERGYRWAQICAREKHYDEAVRMYGNLLDQPLSEDRWSAMAMENVELLLRLAAEIPADSKNQQAKKRAEYLAQATALVDKLLQKTNLILVFGKAIAMKVQIEMLCGHPDQAQALVNEYMPRLSEIHRDLVEQDPQGKLGYVRASPMPECRYLLAKILWDGAQTEAKKPNANEDAIKDALFGARAKNGKRNGLGAYNHAINVFVKYPESKWAASADKLAKTIEGFVKARYKIEIKTNSRQAR